MKKIEDEIKNTVKELLTDKKIDLFIGYEEGTLPLRTSPCFVTNHNNVDKLVYNSLCSNNLTVYLPQIMSKNKEEKPNRVGILCKGCDSRSLVGLIKENQIKREDIFIVGISCEGIVDLKKILYQLGDDEIVSVDEDKDSITVKLRNGKKNFKKKDYLFESCLNCAYPKPNIYDVLINKAEYSPKVVIPDTLIREFSEKPREERWQIFEKEISKCIRCYACRNACPNCYCKECFAEETKPKWIGVTNDLSDIIFYHIIRILHQAGRCVDCGACVRACPMDINLRLFTRILVDEVKERFDYDPGISIEEPAPLATYEFEDKQEFMTEVE